MPAVELPPASGLVERLTALTQPRNSPIAVHLVPGRLGAAARWRDISVVAARQEPPFRLGDAVRLSFQSSHDAFVTLIDVGTSGHVHTVVPNEWCRAARVQADRWHHFPSPEFGEFEITLTGIPGRERVFAIATLVPIAADEIKSLVDEVERLDPATWAACACEFTIQRSS